jgi:hypothetical protein
VVQFKEYVRKKAKKRNFKEKSRLIILNEDSFEEIFSIGLTPMNIFVVGTLGAIAIVIVTTFIIAFTPLREYIPGYASTNLRNEATQLALKSDSLTTALKNNDAYINGIKDVLTGKIKPEKFNKDSILSVDTEKPSLESATASESEKQLREEVYQEEKAAKKIEKKKRRK